MGLAIRAQAAGFDPDLDGESLRGRWSGSLVGPVGERGESVSEKGNRKGSLASLVLQITPDGVMHHFACMAVRWCIWSGAFGAASAQFMAA